MQDKNVQDVIQQFQRRSELGIKKYGCTTDREDLSLNDWLQHLKEELQDAVLYINAAQRTLRNSGGSDREAENL
jgi:hypothetical protein